MVKRISSSKLLSMTKSELIALVDSLQNKPEPEPKIIEKIVEKIVPMEVKEDKQKWQAISEAHIRNVLSRFQQSIVLQLKPPAGNAIQASMSLNEAVEEIINQNN